MLKFSTIIAILLCYLKTQLWGSTAMQVSPASYKEDNKLFIQFTCGEYLYSTDQLLAWYQIKGTEKTLLALLQENQNHIIMGAWRLVVLYKTIEQSDNATEIVCEKIKLLPNGSFSVESKSERIPIKFQKLVTPSERYVTIVPSDFDVVLFDENDELRLSCTGTKPVDGRRYNWYLHRPLDTHILIPTNQTYETANHTSTLNLRLHRGHHQNQLYCAQDYHFKFVPGTRTPPILTYGEHARSKVIKLIHKGEGNSTAAPVVTAEKYLDNNRQIQCGCYAFLKDKELLSWYQINGSNPILLNVTQLKNSTYQRGQWMSLGLKKTLSNLDNGTILFCAKESELDGTFTKGPKSRRIPIKFEREIKSLETPFVHVEPRDTTVYFDVNSIIYFNCSGSKPVDGRQYTWFMKDPDSTLTKPVNQTYDVSMHQNYLILYLNESHHEKQLYCSQNYNLYIQSSNGSLMRVYGELVTSHLITLVHWERVKTQHMMVTIALPALVTFLVVTVVAVVVTIVVKRCRHATEPSRAMEENVYNYTYEDRVTYANTDFRVPPATYATLTRPETNYVNVRTKSEYDNCLSS